MIALLKRRAEVGAFIITAIRDRPSLVAEAERLNNASEVEPVFRPVQPA